MSDNTSLIIHTKLNRPSVRDDFVPRLALYERLNQNRQRPLTLVTAPAGYGKSTLLSSWLDTLPDEETAWLSLDGYDDSPATFFTYFMTAVQTLFPHTGQKTIALLSQSELPPHRVLLATIINDLSLINTDFVLVLDDYHLIQHPAIQKLMVDLLAHIPETCHLVFASRIDPHLPVSKYRARNQVTEIRAIDLRFSQTEAERFLRQSVKKSIDEQLLTNIYERSEGWITGLHLAALSMRQLEDHARLNDILQKESHFLVDYLMSEVLIDQSEVIQELLLKTSLLERFCPELCDALLDRPHDTDFNGHQFIDYLIQHNLFTISLDQEQVWYRYHHLFSDFLQNKLNQHFSPTDIAHLHKKTSQWLEENGLFEESFHHAFATNDIHFAAQVIERSARLLLDKDLWYILSKWLERLPEAIIERSAMLLLAKSWIAFFRFDLWEIPPFLEKVEQLLDKEDEAQRPLWGEVHHFWGQHFYWLGQQELSLQHLDLAVEQIPKAYHLARGQAELFWGLAMYMNGRGDEAIKQMQHWLYYEKTWGVGIPSNLIGGLIFIALLANNLPQAIDHAQKIIETAINTNNTYITIWLNYLLGLSHFYKNHRVKANAHFCEVHNNHYVLHQAAVIDNMSVLALTFHSLNQPEKANSIIAELHKFAWETKNPAYISKAHSSQAHLFLLQGDVRSARQQFDMVDVTVDQGTLMFYFSETIRLTECRVLIAEGTKESLITASQKLDTYLQTERNFHNITKMIEILLLQTICYQKQELTDSALSALNEAIVLAERGGSIWPFVEAGPNLLNLLSQIHPNDYLAPFLQTLKEAVGNGYDTPTPASSHHHMPQSDAYQIDLTFREQEILEFLAKGSSNQEIARQLTISVHTVKRHVSNLSKKLGAQNRRQAVAIAESAGLLNKSGKQVM